MKLSKRETIMIVSLLFIVMIAAFWFLLLSPAKDNLAASQTEYVNLKAQDNANQIILDSVSSLTDTQLALEANVIDIEDNLLPALNTEVITEHLANIFEANNMKFITEIACDPIITDSLQLADGSYSANTVQWVRINMKVSGTDGITEGGIPAVGYNEFISAVKEIEAVEPDAIHVSSISMEDTDQGFQYFNVAVDVFAFNLPVRISEITSSDPYTIWDRDPVETGGLLGLPYENIPGDLFDTGFFRPFADVQITSETPTPPTDTTETAQVDILTPTVPPN